MEPSTACEHTYPSYLGNVTCWCKDFCFSPCPHSWPASSRFVWPSALILQSLVQSAHVISWLSRLIPSVRYWRICITIGRGVQARFGNQGGITRELEPCQELLKRNFTWYQRIRSRNIARTCCFEQMWSFVLHEAQRAPATAGCLAP